MDADGSSSGLMGMMDEGFREGVADLSGAVCACDVSVCFLSLVSLRVGASDLQLMRPVIMMASNNIDWVFIKIRLK